MKSSSTRAFIAFPAVIAFLSLLAGFPACTYAAGELRATDTSGKTLYAVILSPSSQAYNGTTFAAIANANWSTYATAMTEQGTTGIYVGSFPTSIATAGQYGVLIYEEINSGTVAVGDRLIASGVREWSGTSLVTLSGVNATETVTGVKIGASQSYNNTGQTTAPGWIGTSDVLLAGESSGISTAATNTGTLLNGQTTITAKTNLIGSNGGDSPNAVTGQTNAATAASQTAPANQQANIQAATLTTVPAAGTTTGVAETLTFQQSQALLLSLAAGGVTNTAPAASSTGTVTYYLVGRPKTAGNVVAVSSPTFDATRTISGRTVLIQQPFPAL